MFAEFEQCDSNLLPLPPFFMESVHAVLDGSVEGHLAGWCLRFRQNAQDEPEWFRSAVTPWCGCSVPNQSKRISGYDLVISEDSTSSNGHGASLPDLRECNLLSNSLQFSTESDPSACCSEPYSLVELLFVFSLPVSPSTVQFERHSCVLQLERRPAVQELSLSV